MEASSSRPSPHVEDPVPSPVDDDPVKPSSEVSREGNSLDGAAPAVPKEAEEEEEECGFCLFMKSGPCGESFEKWEECIEGAEKGKEDIAAKCYHVTLLLKECMEKNLDYYAPVLRAEKEMNEQAQQRNSADSAETNREDSVPQAGSQQEKLEDQNQKEDIGKVKLEQQSGQDRPREEESPAPNVEVRNIGGAAKGQSEQI